MGCRPPVFLMQSLAFRSLRLDRDLVANILDVAVQEVSYLLNGCAERETISEFGQINRRPRPFASSAHGPPHRCPNRKQAGSVVRYFCGATTEPGGLGIVRAPQDARSGTPASPKLASGFPARAGQEHGRTIPLPDAATSSSSTRARSPRA
jgi:hypothetical protein